MAPHGSTTRVVNKDTWIQICRWEQNPWADSQTGAPHPFLGFLLLVYHTPSVLISTWQLSILPHRPDRQLRTVAIPTIPESDRPQTETKQQK